MYWTRTKFIWCSEVVLEATPWPEGASRCLDANFMALTSKVQALALDLKTALIIFGITKCKKDNKINCSYNNKLMIIYVQLIINEYLSKKQWKFSSLPILSGCQTYRVYFNFFYGRMLKGLGVEDPGLGLGLEGWRLGLKILALTTSLIWWCRKAMHISQAAQFFIYRVILLVSCMSLHLNILCISLVKPNYAKNCNHFYQWRSIFAYISLKIHNYLWTLDLRENV